MGGKLVKPSADYKQSFLEAEREYETDNKPRHASPGFSREELEKNFEKYLEKVASGEKGIGMKEGYVPSSSLWLVDGGEFIGSVSIRHQLNDQLLKKGGHIGYAIRPSKRGQGYGTKILALALQEAKKLGIQKVLVTCDEDNAGSAKVIENNGGVLENKVEYEGKLLRRYWI